MDEVYWGILILILIGFIFGFIFGWICGINSKDKGIT